MEKSASEANLSAYQLEAGRWTPYDGIPEIEPFEPCAERSEQDPAAPAAVYRDEATLSVYRRWLRWVSIMNR